MSEQFVCPGLGCKCHMNGCVNGVAIDVDEFCEGWQRDVAYPLAPCHPHYCRECGGTGEQVTDEGSGDCPACNGVGVTSGVNDCQERLEAAAEGRAA